MKRKFLLKRTILTILSLLPFFVQAQIGNFKISGKVTGVSPSAKMYLRYGNGEEPIIKTSDITNGTFSFTGTTKQPCYAQIMLDHEGKDTVDIFGFKDARSFCLENTALLVDVKDSVYKATISGSKLNMEFDRYIKSLSAVDRAAKGIDKEFEMATDEQRSDQNFTKGLQERYDKIRGEKDKITKKYINENPNSYLNLLLLNEMLTVGSILERSELAGLYAAMPSDLRDSELGKKVGAQINVNNGNNIGNLSYDISGTDVNGKPVKLSDFKGKYVLLDFWASWCMPCREENPNLTKAYARFKDKGLSIFGVTLDDESKKTDWLDAIKEDGLTWTNVLLPNAEGGTVSKNYNITSIPLNFLIDPSGKIIAKNLRGEELEKKLATLFN